MPEYPNTHESETTILDPGNVVDHVHVLDGKRDGLMDEELIVFSSTTDAVKEVALIIIEGKPVDVHPSLYNIVMEQGCFNSEALMAALICLLGNMA
ncbi:Acetyl-coenzyme A synthetase [Hordeum vulgare]|nr:Acetyl-coenzyme A synthetase [Hordeum vulgare]KAE8813130.1 Acetyl-coenzyme A synthetase [Hordeum vulgare]